MLLLLLVGVIVVALGCPDLVTPVNAWLERSGDRVMVKCNDTLETWFLTCQDNRWIGDVTNCSSSRSTKVLYCNSDRVVVFVQLDCLIFHLDWVNAPYTLHLSVSTQL